MDDLPIKAIIFDKDGTLFNYGEVWGSVVSQSLEANIPWPEKITKKSKAEALRSFEIIAGVDAAGHSYSDGILFRHNKVISGSWRLVKTCFRYHIPVFKAFKGFVGIVNRAENGLKEKLATLEFPDVQEVFERCHSQGYQIGIVTNDTALSTSMFLEKMDVKNYISFVRTGESDTKHKPSPQAIREFCKEKHLEASEVCVVGDTIIDMVFAHKGKCGRSIAVLTGSGDFEALSKLADAVYPQLIDILHDPVLFPENLDYNKN